MGSQVWTRELLAGPFVLPAPSFVDQTRYVPVPVCSGSQQWSIRYCRQTADRYLLQSGPACSTSVLVRGVAVRQGSGNEARTGLCILVTTSIARVSAVRTSSASKNVGLDRFCCRRQRRRHPSSSPRPFLLSVDLILLLVRRNHNRVVSDRHWFPSCPI
jgi:hypothetical protein